MGAWSWLVELVRGPSAAGAAVRRDWAGVIRGRAARVIETRDGSHARFEIAGPARGLTIHRRTGVDDLLHVAVVTGDPDLDAIARIQGDRILALSLLDPPARAALGQALRLDLVVEEGVVRGVARKPDVPGIVEVGAVLASALAPTGRPPLEVLAERLASEPLGSVRLVILRALADQGPPWEDQALKHASRDPDGQVRLLAATRTTDTRALAALTLDPSVPADVRDRAFHQLRRVDPTLLRTELAQAIRDPARSRLALERAAAERDPGLVDAILVRGGEIVGDDAPLALEGAALLRALEPHDDPRIPDLLLEVVERAPAHVARQALLQLRGTPPQRVLARLAALDRPELSEALGEVRAQLETVDAGEVVAAELGLTWTPRQRTASGTLEGLPLEVKLEPGQVGFYVTGLPSALAVEGAEVPQTVPALAWLPADQRDLIGRVVAEAPRFGVRDGRLHAVGPMASGPRLVARARRLAEVVAGFQWLARQSPSDRLEAAFVAETVPALRRKLGAQLFAERPDRAEPALRDPDAGVRTLAATRLRRPDVLLRVVLDSREAPVRRDALGALAELGDEAAIAGAVTVALDDPDLRSTALTVVGRHKLRAHADHVGSLLDAAPPDQRGGWVRIALQVLGVLQVPSTERHLLRALQSDDEQLRRLAILALGQVGSPRAVPPLKELASGWRVSWEVHAARTALEAIRARATVGALSVAEGGGGTLAVAKDGGELGVAEDE